MINYTWNFWNFEIIKNQNTLTNIVKAIHWVYSGTDENNITGEIRGVTHLLPPNENNFIDFENITQEWAMNIISNDENIDIENMNIDIERQIEKIKNPPILNIEPSFNN